MLLMMMIAATGCTPLESIADSVDTSSGTSETKDFTYESDITETQYSEQTEHTTMPDAVTEKTERTEAAAEQSETEQENDYELDSDWALYIINNENPLPDGFSVVTKSVQGERELDVRCADYAIAMIKAAAEDGIKLKVSSAYRSVEKQRENIEMYIEWYISMGYSYDDAVSKTYNEVAVPGCSEHNAGLAMDIESEDYFDTHAELETDFDTMPEFEWLIENCYKFGFILSFPKNKESITGFPYEPWHYRYVGIEHARAIHELGITLNEYLEIINA